VIGDDDGVILLATSDQAVLDEAAAIRAVEEKQADEMRGGRSLRDQLAFDTYLEERRADPSLTFRDHLKRVRGAIET
jgi:hypothetical protein